MSRIRELIRLLEDVSTRNKYKTSTDKYKSELQKTYEEWYKEIAGDLAGEESAVARGRMTDAALLLLLMDLKRIGRERLEEAYMMSIEAVDITPEMVDEIELLIASNDDYLTDSLIPALGERVEKNVTPEIWFAGLAAILGTFTGFTSRVGLYAGAYWDAIWRGAAQEQVIQGREDFQILWMLDPRARHCFKIGTAISTPDGPVPIEDVQVGDYVTTLAGDKRVTKLYQQSYDGQLCEIRSDSNVVQCTPNHPFLTQRGWIEAGEIRHGDSVFLQDRDQFVPTKVALPDSDYSESVGCQVSVSRSVSALLALLPFGKWFKARMSMPIVPVGLNNQVTDFDVYDEFGFDKKGRFVGYAKIIKHGAQFILEAGRFVALNLLMPFYHALHNLFVFFGMIFVPLLNLFYGFGIKHRVMLSHMFAGSFVDNSVGSFFSKTKSKFHGFISNLGMFKRKMPGNYSGSLRGIMLLKIRNVFVRPNKTMIAKTFARWKLFAALCAVVALTIAIITACGASFSGPMSSLAAISYLAACKATEPFLIATVGHLANWLATIFTGIVGVRVSKAMAEWRAESLLIALFGTLCFTYWIAAKLAGMIRIRWHKIVSPCSDWFSVLYTKYANPQNTLVYNLEVEDVHHYVANGFVVHNCDSCLEFAGAYINYDVMLVMTGGAVPSYQVDCDGNCRCLLLTRSGPEMEWVVMGS